MLFDGEKPLRTNETWLTNFAALTIAFIQWNGESVPVPSAGNLAENQIRAWKIGNHQCRPALSVGSRKRNDNDFARYRFDHAASSSGESQSRPRTDSLSSAPLNLSTGASDASSSSSDSLMLIINNQIFTTKDTKHTEKFWFGDLKAWPLLRIRCSCGERSTKFVRTFALRGISPEAARMLSGLQRNGEELPGTHCRPGSSFYSRLGSMGYVVVFRL